jgi:hypothetical protein
VNNATATARQNRKGPSESIVPAARRRNRRTDDFHRAAIPGTPVGSATHPRSSQICLIVITAAFPAARL